MAEAYKKAGLSLQLLEIMKVFTFLHLTSFVFPWEAKRVEHCKLLKSLTAVWVWQLPLASADALQQTLTVEAYCKRVKCRTPEQFIPLPQMYTTVHNVTVAQRGCSAAQSIIAPSSKMQVLSHKQYQSPLNDKKKKVCMKTEFFLSLKDYPQLLQKEILLFCDSKLLIYTVIVLASMS